jgi:pilus assembly protein CpaE
MTGKIRVLIVDDIAESRDNVAKLLRFEPDIEVVGMADGGEEAVEMAAQLDPHIPPEIDDGWGSTVPGQAIQP